MSLEQSLFQALTVLGQTADEVADRLYAMGFRGRQRDPADCPLARYLAESLYSAVLLSAGHSCVVDQTGAALQFKLPGPCQVFIGAFDAGKWPQLVASSDEYT